MGSTERAPQPLAPPLVPPIDETERSISGGGGGGGGGGESQELTIRPPSERKKVVETLELQRKKMQTPL